MLLLGITCSNSSLKDVVFVIDTSQSIGGQSNFDLIKEFTANIATNLIINSSRSAVGVILFSSTPHIEFNLTAHTNLSALKSAINNLPFSRENPTNIPKALRLLSSTAQNGSLGLRKDSSKIAIVITDGQSNGNVSDVSLAAMELHSLKLFDVYVVGFGGNKDNQRQLEEIASCSQFFSNRTSDGLQQIRVEILNQLCSGKCPVTIVMHVYVCRHVNHTYIHLIICIYDDY